MRKAISATSYAIQQVPNANVTVPLVLTAIAPCCVGAEGGWFCQVQAARAEGQEALRVGDQGEGESRQSEGGGNGERADIAELYHNA